LELGLPRFPGLAFTLGRVFLVLAILGVGAVAQPTETSAAADVGLPYFGVYLNGYDVNATQRAKNVGAGTVALQFNWQLFEPVKTGTLSAEGTANLDAMVNSAVAKGLTPVGMISGAPSWAGPHGAGPVYAAEYGSFVTFVGNLAQQYGPMGVHHWMIFPEPDAVTTTGAEASRSAWGDEPQNYATLVKQASARMKQIDATAKVIVGPLAHDRFDPAKSTAWCPNPPNYPYGHYNCGGIFSYEFLDKIFTGTGLASSVDAVALNAYAYYGAAWEGDQPGYDVAAKVRHVRNRLNGLGVSLPIVVGESGLWSTNAPARPYRVNNIFPVPEDLLESSPTRQAEYVGQMYARARDAGAAAVIWFTLDEIDTTVRYGLYDEGLSPKSSFNAYRQASATLSSAIRTFSVGSLVTVTSGYAERYGFADASDNNTIVVWAMNAANPTAQVAVRGSFQAYDQAGNAVAPAGTSSAGALYNLTASPLYLRGKSYRSLVPVTLRAG
jgi:hypothetical protein